MGFFSKLWKKVKKGFKSIFKGIGKGIKKLFKGFGKFMNKIGIVGQIAMSFILPGIGQALSKTAGAAFKGITGTLAQGGKIAQAAGKMIEASGNFAKMGHSAFRTVTEGVSSFVTEMGGAALSNLPGAKTLFPDITKKSFKTAWSNVESKFLENTGKVMNNFNNLIGNNVVNPTSVEAAALAKAQAVTGEGLTPSATAEVKPFDKSAFDISDASSNLNAPTTIDTSSGFETPKGFGMETPEFKVEGPVLDKSSIQIDAPKVQKSLLEKASDFVKDTAGSIVDEIQAAPSKIPEYAGELAEDKIKTELVEKVVGEPEMMEETLSSGYVMPYQEVTVGQYQSQAINDRAYQMALDPVGYGMTHPFGYPAQDFYKQQMLQFSRPQV